MSPTLRTERLLLNEYTLCDEESFVALFCDEDVVRWMGEGPQPEAQIRALFGRVFDVYREKRFDVWAVRLDGRHVGHAEIKRTDTVDGYELIYALAPSVWRQGVGTELARAIVEYGFGVLGLDEVHATVHADNVGSFALLRRLGFEHVRDIDDGHTTRVLTMHGPGRRPRRPGPG